MFFRLGISSSVYPSLRDPHVASQFAQQIFPWVTNSKTCNGNSPISYLWTNGKKKQSRGAVGKQSCCLPHRTVIGLQRLYWVNFMGLGLAIIDPIPVLYLAVQEEFHLDLARFSRQSLLFRSILAQGGLPQSAAEAWDDLICSHCHSWFSSSNILHSSL